MADDVHFHALDDALVLHGFIPDVQPDDFGQRQNMDAAQVEIRVWRGEAIQVRTADGGEQQQIWLRGDDAMEAGINGHAESGNLNRLGAIAPQVKNINGCGRSFAIGPWKITPMTAYVQSFHNLCRTRLDCGGRRGQLLGSKTL